MAAKYYCDVCEKDVTGSGDRVRRLLGRVMIEIMVRVENTWNAGHVCDACVLRVANEGRPVKKNESWLDDQIKERANA
jgi:hypothetical protein